MKTKRPVSVAIAIFAGMVIGSLVALQIGRSFIDFCIGALIGWSTGCFLMHPIRIAANIARIFGAIVSFICSRPFWAAVWRQLHVDLKDLGRLFLNVSSALVVLATHFGLAVWSLHWFDFQGDAHQVGLSEAAITGLSLLISWSMAGFLFHTNHPVQISDDPLDLMFLGFRILGKVTESFGKWSFAGKCVWLCMPSTMILISVGLIQVSAFVLFIIGAVVYEYAPIVVSKARSILIFIHSDELIQVSIYSVLGTVLMWSVRAQVSMVLFGGVLGAVIGELSFRFVSVRFPKPTVH